MVSELESKLVEHGMDKEKAKLFSDKVKDQIVPPEIPPEEEPLSQNWRTDPATEAQIAEIKGLTQALGGDKGQDLVDMMLAYYGRDLDELNGEEAAAIVSALDKAPPELWEAMLAWNKAETLGLSWPEAAVLMGAGGAGAGAAVGLSVKSLYSRFGTWAAANLPQRLGIKIVEHGAKVHTLEPAKRGLLSRLLGRAGGRFLGVPILGPEEFRMLRAPLVERGLVTEPEEPTIIEQIEAAIVPAITQGLAPELSTAGRNFLEELRRAFTQFGEEVLPPAAGLAPVQTVTSRPAPDPFRIRPATPRFSFRRQTRR